MKMLTLTHAQTGRKMTIAAAHVLAILPMSIHDDLKIEHHSKAKSEVVLGPSLNYHVKETAVTIAAMIEGRALEVVRDD